MTKKSYEEIQARELRFLSREKTLHKFVTEH